MGGQSVVVLGSLPAVRGSGGVAAAAFAAFLVAHEPASQRVSHAEARGQVDAELLGVERAHGAVRRDAGVASGNEDVARPFGALSPSRRSLSKARTTSTITLALI